MRKTMLFLAALICSTAFAQNGVTLYYNYKKSDVSFTNTKRVDSLLKALRVDNPDAEFTFIGHADSIGGPHYNDSLSEVRVQKLQDYFVKRGVAKEKISYEALGMSKPVADNGTDEGRAQNRRVEVLFGALSNLTAQRFDLFKEDTTAIRTNSGCLFTINANDLVTEDGSEIGDSIVVFIKEYNDPVDFIVGEIPMENKQKRIFYDSYSMFDIRVFSDSLPLIMKEGASYAVQCPIRNTDKQVNLYEFNKYQGAWDNLSDIRNIAEHKPEVFKAEMLDVFATTASADGAVLADGTEVNSGEVKDVKKEEPPVYLSTVNLNTASKSSRREIGLAKWTLLEEVRKDAAPSCVDSGACDYGVKLAQLQSHVLDSVWYTAAADTLRADGIEISYRMNKYFKQAVFRINVNEKYFMGSQFMNGFEWRHKIKDMSKEEFDQLMNKQWTDVNFRPVDGTDKKFELVLKHKGGKEKLLLQKRFMKAGEFVGIKENGTDLYSKAMYEQDYCFWKENWKYMSDDEIGMNFEEWMNYAALNKADLIKKYQYLASKADSINNTWCNMADNNKMDVKPIDKNSTVELYNFALINFDAEISSRDYADVKLSFEDQNGGYVEADTVYQIMKGLNSLRTFIPASSLEKFKIMKKNDTFFYVKAKGGKRYLSAVERIEEEGEVTVKLRDVTQQTSTEKGLRKEFSIYFPAQEWIMADVGSIEE